MISKAENKKGFSLIEIILAVSIFALCITSLTGGLIYGQQSNLLAIHRAQAVFLANEGLEASQNIAEENFTNLVDGSYGINIENNTYVFSNIPDGWDVYERQITISSMDTDTKQVTSDVVWSWGGFDEGRVTLTTYVSNWKPND